jgi:ABC-2 type transporter
MHRVQDKNISPIILTCTVVPDTGRTVCATIHQPSSAVFEMFDDLLLLKKGGNVVFFGELGRESVNLVEYFESKGANPIKFGENPAAWMLTCYSGEHAETTMLDWGAVYRQSKQYEEAQKGIAAIQTATDESKKIAYDEVFVTTFWQRLWLMIERLYRIYKRSPAYNLARLMIAIFYSFIIGSVFLQRNGRRDIWTENELSVCCLNVFDATNVYILTRGVPSIKQAVLSTMFLSLIVIGTSHP